MRPEEIAELQAMSSRVERELDALTQAQRAGVIQRLRRCLGAGEVFSADDERVSSLWESGRIGVGEFLHHFGERVGRLGPNDANAI